MTVLQIIQCALELCRVISAEETPTAADAATGLRVLNSMLDSWSAENLAIYEFKREVFELTADKSEYSMGLLAGADFESSRPMVIMGAAVGDLTKNPIYGEVEIPVDDPETPEDESLDIPDPEIIGYDLKVFEETYLEVIDYQRWIDLSTKQLDSAMPHYLFREGSSQNEILHFWPVPNREMGFVLYSKKALGQFAELSDEVNLPPGYLEAIENNLAIKLAPRFGISLPASVFEDARDLKGVLKVKNMRTPRMVSDVLTKKPFNLISGE